MKNSHLLLAIATTFTLSYGTAFAADGDSMTMPSAPTTPSTMMEQCKVVDSNGKGLIKANMADSGPNVAGDPNAWINVPAGQCSKINTGDFSGVSQDIQNKVDTTGMTVTPSTMPSTTDSNASTSTTPTTPGMTQSKNNKLNKGVKTSKNKTASSKTDI